MKSQARLTVKILAFLFLFSSLIGSCRRVEPIPLTCLPESRQLTDAKGREIRFFDLQFCGGPNPPEEMVREYREELEALEEKYTVIGMTCNLGGIPYP